MINVTKVDHVYLRVTSEDSIEQELAEHFTFEVPGAKFMPSVRNKFWDGKIRLYSTQKKLLYVGLLDYVRQFAIDREIDIHINVERENTIVDMSYIDQLNLPFPPRDYQQKAAAKCIREGRALVLSPTASGKSLIIYLLTRFYESNTLIVVPTTSLVHQMASDFVQYGYKEPIHKIMSGQEKEVNKCTISTWQSIYKQPKSWFNQFDVVIGDEAHLFKAKSLTSLLTKMTDVPYKFGFTGTLDGTQTHRLVLEGLFGSVYKVTTTAELMKKDQLARLKVKCIVLDYPEKHCKIVSAAKYQEEITFLINNKKRNKFILNLALSMKANTLILFERVDDHGRVLFESLRELIASSVDNQRKTFFVHGGVDGTEREDIRSIVERESDAIIVASYGTFSTGVNIRNLHNIIFASPSKSRIRVLQSVGRGLRLSDNKTKTTLYDIADNLSYNQRNNYTLNHFQERVMYYNEEQFDYEIFNIPLKGN